MAKFSDVHDADDHSGVTGLVADAANVTFTPAGTIAATNVQDAIEEVASEAGGGSGLLIPTLLQSPAPGGGNDEEFTGSLGDMTAVDGGSGTVSLVQSSGTGVYDLATRSGWVLMQPGTSSGEDVELKADVTLADGACVVAYLSFALDQAGTASANNEIALGIGVNDNDTGRDAGAQAQTFMIQLDAEASGAMRIMAWDATSSVGEMPASNTMVGGWFLRIDRSGLVYRAFASQDGFAWTFVGTKTMGTAANNVWLFASCGATQANRIVVGCPWLRFGTALAVDPFSLT